MKLRLFRRSLDTHIGGLTKTAPIRTLYYIYYTSVTRLVNIMHNGLTKEPTCTTETWLYITLMLLPEQAKPKLSWNTCGAISKPASTLKSELVILSTSLQLASY